MYINFTGMIDFLKSLKGTDSNGSVPFSYYPHFELLFHPVSFERKIKRIKKQKIFPLLFSKHYSVLI
ncbi:hypothetical protein CN925_06840 [Bacillus sp. AFS055030]|nr:hypothetical protein CN925_06840 [Bacillus sp. AFS055030]